VHANQPAVAFYERAAGAINPNPEIHVPLSHPGLAGALEEMAKELGYDFT
jgi:hypothetical protein